VSDCLKEPIKIVHSRKYCEVQAVSRLLRFCPTSLTRQGPHTFIFQASEFPIFLSQVQRLVEICKSYRQRQRIEAPHEPANGPPKKKRLMSLPADNDQLPWPPSLDSKVASPQNKHHFQGGGTLLADFTPFSGRSDPLAADSNGWDRGESAADTTGLRIEGRAKTETGLEQPALTYVHSSMRGDSAQPFDHTFLEGQFGNETRLLTPPPSPEPFLSWSGVVLSIRTLPYTTWPSLRKDGQVV
jgi:hypothetical protein